MRPANSAGCLPMPEKQPASAPSAVRFETGKIIEWRAAIQPSICLFNRLSSNRVQAAFYALCGKSWRNSHLLPLPWERVGVGTLWVLTHFGAGGGFGVGMAAIRHVLPLNFLFVFGIFPRCGREIGCLPPPSANRHEH